MIASTAVRTAPSRTPTAARLAIVRYVRAGWALLAYPARRSSFTFVHQILSCGNKGLSNNAVRRMPGGTLNFAPRAVFEDRRLNVNGLLPYDQSPLDGSQHSDAIVTGDASPTRFDSRALHRTRSSLLTNCTDVQ